MPSKIYLFNYNNYYNRKVKILNESELSQNIFAQANINFNKSDGINTSQVINYPATEKNPDYAVITDIVNGVEKITSRWYVTEASWQRLNQYVLTLKRDVMADYWPSISTCTAHIYKGWVANTSPLIFNSENTSLNKIKIGETLLRDKSHTPWIVGYVGEKAFADTAFTVETVSVTDATIFKNSLDELYAEFPRTYTSKQPVLGSGSNGFYYAFYVKCVDKDNPSNAQMFLVTLGSAGFKFDYADETNINKGIFIIDQYNLSEFVPAVSRLARFLSSRMGSTDEFGIYYDFDNNIDDASYAAEQKAKNNAGKTAKVGVDYYTLYYSNYEKSTKSENYIESDNRAEMMWLRGNLEQAQQNGLGTSNWNGTTVKDARVVTIVNDTYNWYGQWNKIESNYITEEIGKGVVQCEDAPYYMFCIPYNPIDFRYKTTASDITSDVTVSRNIATQLIKHFGANLYDIQLLPYFPTQEILPNVAADDIGWLKLNEINKSFYTLIKKKGAAENAPPVSFIYWAPRTSFSFEINQEFAASDDVKVQNETESARLCSPNYASYFDFSIAKNRGVKKFLVDCNYKPGIPYIHVVPKFNKTGIYGASNYNDARGLICSGDFSMTQVQDSYINYLLNNKNYEAIFRTQMDTLDKQHNYENTQALVGAIAGAVGAAGAGAAGGAMSFGTPLGIIGGAAISGAASLAGGLIDYDMGKNLRKTIRENTEAIHNLQIGNIQSMPNPLSKVGAQNQNNKLYPFVEIYKCTQTEVEAFENQIKYSGMTVGVTDTLNKYYNADPDASTNFIQADVIRLEIPDDNHVIAMIADELRKGVYITKV